MSRWEVLADEMPGGAWTFAVTFTGNQYGDRHATAFDPGARVLYRATLDAHDRITHVEVTVPGDRLDAPVDIARAGRELRAFLLSRGEPERRAKPTTAEVADLLRRAVTRAEIAERYGRPLATVDNWIRTARAEYPDLPQAKRGPRVIEHL